ncbi:MAG: hypothetical protein ACJAYB_001453 [Psychromonas sp.]|jgi:hypothetical protein
MNVSTEIDLNLPFIRMLIMKKNMLAVLIAGTFLVACSDGSGLSSKSIQVFDGPVQFADVVANCGGEDLDLGRTDFNGTVRSTDFVIINTPELCEFTATGTEAIGASIGASIDTSNNKLMPKISYVIPRGLLKVGDSITLSPLTTLIAKQIEANTANNITGISVSDVATEVVTALYPGLINATDVNALDMARDMEGTITKLKAAYPNSVPLVIATNNVTSDVLVYSQTTVVGLADIIKTSTKVAEQVISVNDDYPIVSTDSTKIKVASFDVGDAVLAVENSTAIAVSIVENDIPEEPVATGATGTAG